MDQPRFTFILLLFFNLFLFILKIYYSLLFSPILFHHRKLYLPLFILKFAFVKGTSIRFTHQSLKVSMNMLQKRVLKLLVLAK